MRTLIISLLLLLTSCSSPPPTPKFHKGQFVRSVLTHDVGQVIYTNCWDGNPTCWYTVRFPFPKSRVNTSWFGPDVTINTPMASIPDMAEFELEACE